MKGLRTTQPPSLHSGNQLTVTEHFPLMSLECYRSFYSARLTGLMRGGAEMRTL